MEKKKPANSFPVGNVLISLWPAVGPKGPYYEPRVQRMFKREDDAKWEYTDYLKEWDLENLSKAAADANNWIQSNPATLSNEAPAAEEEQAA